MISTASLSAQFTIYFLIASGHAQLDNLCGDCWCINNPTGTNDSAACPPPTNPGLQQTFPNGLADWYLTLVDTAPLPLVAADGSSECFPFEGLMEPQELYPESHNPACAQAGTTSIDEGYCAYVFEEEDPCRVDSSNNYEAVTFPTEEAALEAGGVITHKGGCGVCSSAQDLAVRVNNLHEMGQKSLLCGTQYYITGRNFGELVQCFENIGLTAQCSKLWSHFTASNAALCAAPCFAHEPPYNGPAPQCALSECLQCAEDVFQRRFDELSGRTLPGSGILDPFLASACSLYYPVVHELCPAGEAEDIFNEDPGFTEASTLLPVPTMAPASLGYALDLSMGSVLILSVVFLEWL